MHGHLPPGITVAKAGDSLEEWQMDLRVLDENPLYQNQTYRLKFTFTSKYPIGVFCLSLFSKRDISRKLGLTRIFI